jgi:parallel beta-helix repeat protein
LEGIFLGNSSNNSISGNTIADSRRYGMWLEGASNNSISGNTITGSTFCGFAVESSFNNSISGNTITNIHWGLWLGVFSKNTFCHNNFIINDFDVAIIPQNVNFWDNGIEGNYWSNYGGTDPDGDGIGDTPYVIDANNTDNYPLMNVYWSPCDINHDLKVDMKDSSASARAFSTVAGDPLWNPHADITGPEDVPDGRVDMRDITLIAGHFMEHYP